ncbi:hypothetical protein PBY51_022803 [Eleginops maclovinus]|uniref:Uncharacterized protein n=1 Tax=Eleginops maclovinus TaxID=56733 RepID=A0AAN8AIP0_ELEMC|nr:hypothetical protein PBY51_022803 [Eleginops maclovinus]
MGCVGGSQDSSSVPELGVFLSQTSCQTHVKHTDGKLEAVFSTRRPEDLVESGVRFWSMQKRCVTGRTSLGLVSGEAVCVRVDCSSLRGHGWVSCRDTGQIPDKTTTARGGEVRGGEEAPDS